MINLEAIQNDVRGQNTRIKYLISKIKSLREQKFNKPLVCEAELDARLSGDSGNSSPDIDTPPMTHHGVREKFTRKATDALKEWFLANLESPYPSCQEKELLSNASGLSMRQV